MLDSLRRGATTWVAKVLLGLLIASFAVWGVADMFSYRGATNVAMVGETGVEAAGFQRNYTRQLQAMSRQIGQPIDRDFASALGIPQQVLSQMLSDATLTETADRLGLGVSDQGLAREIAEDPNLRPAGSGTFDRGYFQRLLRDNGLTEAAYIAERRDFSIRNQLNQALVGGMTPPEAFVSLFDRHRGETRAIRYVVLPPEAAGPAPTPSESDLSTWYEANKANFQAPEYRTVSVLAVTPELIADPSSVDEETARQEYERSRANYVTPEQRRVRQVLFPSMEEARQAAARIAEGEALDAVIAERGLTPADVELGLISRQSIVDPAIADAAFSLPANTVSEPIEARFGAALVQVTEIVPEVVRPFEQVRDEIRLSIASREAERTVLDTHDEVEDARAGGATLAEIAARFGLPLTRIETDADGRDPSGAPIAEIPESAEVVAAAFATDEGDENDPVRSGRGFIWYAVEDIRPAQDRPLAEVRTTVVEEWTRERVSQALSARANEMAEAIRRGGDIDTLAAAAGADVETAEALMRSSRSDVLGAEGVEAVFDGPTGHVAAVENPDGSQVVLEVTDVTNPPFFPEAAESQQISMQLGNQIGNSQLTLYIDAMQDVLGVTIDQQALQAAIGTPSR